MEMGLIYVLEDDNHIQQLFKYNLEANKYRVLLFECGEALLQKLEADSSLPDLFILDIMLPGIDGFEVCKVIRKNKRTAGIPVIMLTAKSEEFDKVLGLELGADDYITKPFSVRELVARVKAILRRTNNFMGNNPYPESWNNKDDNVINDDNVLKFKNITLYPDRYEVYKNGKLIDMTLKEFELLKTLMLNKGKVLSREFLLEKIWGFDFYGETRTVDVHIRYLRQKIEDNDSSPEYIETVRGIGYRFRDR